MYGTGGMYPSYGVNQTPFGALLQGVSTAITGYQQTGSLFGPSPTYNYGLFQAGGSGLLTVGIIAILAILIFKAA